MLRRGLVLLSLLACSSTVGETTPPGKLDQLHFTLAGGTAPITMLIVVDDGLESSALRGAIARDDLVTELGRLSGEGLAERNRATWVAVDARAFVVHTSAPQDIVGPITFQTVHATLADVQAFTDTLLQEVQRPAPAPSSNPILAATSSWVRLLDGRRLPATPTEAKVVATSTVVRPDLFVSLITARDDTSPSAPKDYTLTSSELIEESLQVVGVSHAMPRIEAWSWPRSIEDLPVRAPFEQQLFERWFEDGCGDYAPPPNASALCTATASSRGLSSCDASRGHHDPIVNGVPTPTWSKDGWGRVCVVDELEGAARDACVSGQDRGDSGFCPDFGRCDLFRFSGRAMPYAVGKVLVDVTCNLVTE